MLSKVMAYAGGYRKYINAAVGVMLLGIFMSVLPYLFVYRLIEALVLQQEMTVSFVILHLIGIAACEVLYACFYIKGLQLSHMGAYHILKNIRVSLQEKLEKQPLGTIKELGTGTIKKIFIDDIENIELLVAHAVPEGLANLVIPVFVMVAMFFVDWKLTLLCLAALPIGMFAMGMMFCAGTSKMDAYYKAAARMNNTIVEYINGMEVVKVFNRDGESYKRFEGDIMAYRDFTLAWYKVCWPWMALYNSILPCLAVITIPVGAWFVLSGMSTLTDFVLVICMSFSVGAPLLRAMSFAGKIPSLNYKIEALEQLMSAPPLKHGTKAFAGKNHDISFENIHFSYKEDEVLHGVSMQIKEGTMTALVGESGSGKSTLAKLLVHYYDTQSGTIKIGGQDICDMTIEALNQEISYVSQEQFLFNTSLYENIKIGKPDASKEEVLKAARRAQCEEFIARLPEGIEAKAGGGGKQLSGGERQRIALARAILKDAPIIVLDEATAFVDPENEEKMNAAIGEIIKNKTVIVIAHRLSSIVHADNIYVLKKGAIAAVGTHEELMLGSEEYQKLWNASAESAAWKIKVKGETAGEEAGVC